MQATQVFRSSSQPNQRWNWWPLLPTYPYGRRRSLLVELVPSRAWSIEQLHGVWYVAVPIRMTVLRLDHGGLLLYSPIPPTEEVLSYLHELEKVHGRVKSIVLATSSGLEHKISLPALARAFPEAQVWLSGQQWSFPVNLPLAWLGIPQQRSHILYEDGLPHTEEIEWVSLGPLDLGLGTFMEVACFHRSTGILLLTDALVSIPATPPSIFNLDPAPLLFHAREYGAELMVDSPENRRKGWRRIILFANYFRPVSLTIRPFLAALRDVAKARNRSRINHFAFYPFSWPDDWELEADKLLAAQSHSIGLAPVLERLVFVRARDPFLAWLRTLAALADSFILIPAHYHAPVPMSSQHLADLADSLEQRDWAPDQGSWRILAVIDRLLLRWGLVPPAGSPPSH
jgi:hypothetical protein